MIVSDDAPVLPLWIDGHACLKLADAFYPVSNPQTGALLRRVPLCGAEIAGEAVSAAVNAAPAWAALSASARGALLGELAARLSQYRVHFSRLIGEETGLAETQTLAEVDLAVHTLQTATATAAPPPVGPVAGIISDDTAPLSGLVGLAAPLLAAGSTLVAKPSPRAPGAAYALAELTARAGLPPGVFNLLLGDDAAVRGLCADPRVTALHFHGRPDLGRLLQEIASSSGKPMHLQLTPA